MTKLLFKPKKASHMTCLEFVVDVKVLCKEYALHLVALQIYIAYTPVLCKPNLAL